MQLVEFNARKHYAEIRSWWGNQAWPGVDLEMLPKNGFVVESGDQMICAGWLYCSDSVICWLEWIVGNPQISHQERGLGLDILISGVRQKAADLGFKIIFICLSNQRLIDRMISNHRFVVGDRDVTTLMGRT